MRETGPPRADDAEPVAPATAPSVASGARRPYHAPKVRRLGCVRELTLGASAGLAEGAGTFIRP